MSLPSAGDAGYAQYLSLYQHSLIPLYVCLPSLTWALYDYFDTLPDEINYIWPQKRSFGRSMFFWIRYYTLALLVFDVAQIHSFALPGVPTVDVCVAMDPTIRVVGAISLWSVEIIMQLRIYALFGRSKKVAAYNGVLFLASIAAFIWVMVFSAQHRKLTISAIAKKYRLPGCPTINGGIRWAVWVPATVFEFNLFCLALHKSLSSVTAMLKVNDRSSLVKILLQDNILYFLGITGVLILCNVMALGTSAIPWFGFGPFHAALGIMTTRMHLHLVKFSGDSMLDATNAQLLPLAFPIEEPLEFRHSNV